ncbi:hypothetical protein NLG97_g4471 [Lecanicillium saksenae]|uniref:Uncharacterized protein n=1 Tax=Lecanicillium saksenae TaxID=468837 RepID=A0ACC1QXR8_9HYPO|nr:hypothetical protein NLG97_g4471 [Lecanicillium saksenae]
MAEALGAAASGITLFELGTKVCRKVAAVKDAPKTWKKYTDGLHTVACLQSSLESCLRSYPHLKDLRGRVGETEERPLVDYVNTKLSVVRRDAETLLKRCDPTVEKNEGRWGFFLDLFNRGRKSIGFVLKQVAVQDLISVVEATETHLHVALTAIMINSSEAWRAQSETLFVSILDEVRKSGETLDLLEKDGKRIWNAKFEVYLPSNGENCNSRIRGDASSIKATSLPLAEGSRARQAMNKAKETMQAFYNTLMRKPQSDQPLKGKRPLSSSAQTQQGETSSVLHEAGAEPESAGQQADQADGSRVSTSSCLATGRDGDYRIIIEDGKCFSVPTDSVDWRRAGDPNYPAIRRFGEVVDSIPPEKLKDARNKPDSQVVEMVKASAVAALQATEAETVSAEPVVPLSLGPKLKIFIEKTVQLEDCKVSMSTRFRFCVQRVNCSDEEQVFDVMPPCSTLDGTRCEHVTMEVEDGVAFLVSLPTCVMLNSLEYLPCEGTPDDASGSSSFALPLLSKCRGSDACHHTAVEQTGSDQLACASQYSFYGFPVEKGIMDENVSVYRNWLHRDPFGLLRAVIRGEGLPDSLEITLDLLVHFMLAVKRHEDVAAEAGFRQARVWESQLRSCISPDDDAFELVRRVRGLSSASLEEVVHALLWIFWTLELREEFKKVSAAVLRRADHPISQRGSDSALPCRPTLPNHVIEALNVRRLSALSRIADLMLKEMESWRDSYAHDIGKTLVPRDSNGVVLHPSAEVDILRSSLAYGYLDLECSRWLMLRGPASAELGFPGTNFDRIHHAIVLMLDLGKWEVVTKSRTGQTHKPLAELSKLLPTMGGGFSVPFYPSNSMVFDFGNTKPPLHVLIRKLDEEDWGVDLDGLG